MKKQLRIVHKTKRNIQISLRLTVNEAIALHNGQGHSRTIEYDRAVDKLRGLLENLGGRQSGSLFVHE